VGVPTGGVGCRQDDAAVTETEMSSTHDNTVGGIGSSLKTAGTLVAKQAERTQLTNVTLQNAYSAYGKAIFKDAAAHADLEELVSKVRTLLDERKRLSQASANTPAATSLMQKAQQVASGAADLAKGKALDLRVHMELARLGKAAYELNTMPSGLESLRAPIATSVDTLDRLNKEIDELTLATKKAWLSPRGNAFNWKEFSQRTWVVVVSGLVFPPLGIFLSWRKSDWAPKAKWIATGLLSLLLLWRIGGSDKKEQPESGGVAKATVEVEKADASRNKAGPNGEKIIVGGDGVGTDWYFHYYDGGNGEKIMHGDSRVMINGVDKQDTTYDRGTMLKRSRYDSKGQLKEQLTRRAAGDYDFVEYVTEPNGLELERRSVVSFTKTDTKEKIEFLQPTVVSPRNAGKSTDSDILDLVKNSYVNSDNSPAGSEANGYNGGPLDLLAKKFFENPSWKEGEAADGTALVELTGKFMRGDRKLLAKIQFVVDPNKLASEKRRLASVDDFRTKYLVLSKCFRLNAVEFNGVPQNGAAVRELLQSMIRKSQQRE
jgi:hypothetical protein